MTKLWKISMLILLLAIPAMAYIFLQLFGDNQYDIPIYYVSGVDNDSMGCGFADSQHYVPIPTFQAVETPGSIEELASGQITIYSFLASTCDDTCQVKFNQLSRISNYFSNRHSLQVVSVVYDESAINKNLRLFSASLPSAWIFVEGSVEDIKQFITCGLVLPYQSQSFNQFVLVDKESRIRGYYVGFDATDVDRLMTEVRILMSNYEYDTDGKSDS